MGAVGTAELPSRRAPSCQPTADAPDAGGRLETALGRARSARLTRGCPRFVLEIRDISRRVVDECDGLSLQEGCSSTVPEKVARAWLRNTFGTMSRFSRIYRIRKVYVRLQLGPTLGMSILIPYARTRGTPSTNLIHRPW